MKRCPCAFTRMPALSPQGCVAEFLLAAWGAGGSQHRALVLNDGRLEGIVTTMDVLKVVAAGTM